MGAELGVGGDGEIERELRPVDVRRRGVHGDAGARDRDRGGRHAAEVASGEQHGERLPRDADERRRRAVELRAAGRDHGEADGRAAARRVEDEDALARRRGRLDHDMDLCAHVVRRRDGRRHARVADHGDRRAGKRLALDDGHEIVRRAGRDGEDLLRRRRAERTHRRRKREQRDREQGRAADPRGHGASVAVSTSNASRASFEYAVTTTRSRPRRLTSPPSLAFGFALPAPLG